MLTAARLRELIHYDPSTGIFTWRVSRRGVTAGTRAGSMLKGYRIISVDGKRERSGRLAWLYIKGKFPSRRVDHKDGDKSNDKFTNLRLCTHGQNIANSPVRKDSKTGIKGVTFYKRTGKFKALITHKKRRIFLGYFPTAEEARIVRVAAAKKLFGEFARE